jgi:very-short-patch-repair endonuclease
MIRYSPEMRRKAGEAKRRWLASDDPKAKKEMERIRNLNPTQHSETRMRISAALRAKKHRPPVQGGNGRGPTRTETALVSVLAQMRTNVVVPLGSRGNGYPTHYKLDLADADRRICIELDGPSHFALKRQAQDRKKEEKLRSLGWTVLRFWNKEILAWIASGMPTDGSISTIFRQHGIVVSR